MGLRAEGGEEAFVLREGEWSWREATKASLEGCGVGVVCSWVKKFEGGDRTSACGVCEEGLGGKGGWGIGVRWEGSDRGLRSGSEGEGSSGEGGLSRGDWGW